MRFLKEVLALSFIVIFLFVSDILIFRFTNKSIEKMDEKIGEIIEIVYNETYEKEILLQKIESFENDWKNIEEKLSYFSEHEELEKVSVTTTLMKANVQMDAKEDAYEKMEEIKFRIEHIKNKQRFKLNNIF